MRSVPPAVAGGLSIEHQLRERIWFCPAILIASRPTRYRALVLTSLPRCNSPGTQPFFSEQHANGAPLNEKPVGAPIRAALQCSPE
jgi:hypothetical protein